MKTAELTDLLNKRLRTLELLIKSRPQGGDTNSLRLFLNNLIVDIKDFQNLLDKLDGGVKTPETVSAKMRRHPKIVPLNHNQGEATG